MSQNWRKMKRERKAEARKREYLRRIGGPMIVSPEYYAWVKSGCRVK